MNGSIQLPSEAQWERAARSGDQRIYPWGNQRDEARANLAGNIGHPCVVGMYPGQQPGDIYDMAGNVFDWCVDAYGNYPTEPVTDPVGDFETGNRVLRGGACLYAWMTQRSAYRNSYWLGDKRIYVGFRLAQMGS